MKASKTTSSTAGGAHPRGAARSKKPAARSKQPAGTSKLPGGASKQPAGGPKQAAARAVEPAAGAGKPVARPVVPSSRPEEPGRAFLVGSYVFGVIAGFVLGLYGVVLVASGPRPGGTLISVGLLLALIGNTGVPLLVRWLTGTRLGAMIPLIGWTPIVLALAASRTEGDLLLKATATGYLFLAIGVLAPVVVAVLGRARRGLTALPPVMERPRVPSR
ncbi:DUF6113 family protein [Frankia sp. CcI49]|uniref:DUF6113 family protein n=1 Tax=Frankia sp. CcI49 TaxID=1745382 RepID=UPI0032201A4F